jgi:hypothetical protein
LDDGLDEVFDPLLDAEVTAQIEGRDQRSVYEHAVTARRVSALARAAMASLVPCPTG